MTEIEIVLAILIVFALLFLSYVQWSKYYHTGKRKNDDNGV